MAKSATKSERPELQRMIRDIQSNKFQYIIIHKLDRFARNRYDAAIMRQELKKYDVKLLSVTEKNDGSPESILLESLLDGLNEYYSVNLARETMKGLLENAHNGLYNGGWVPFGFDIIDKRYVINEIEARAVKQIFEMYLNGSSYNSILKWLVENGYSTKKGNQFKNNSIHDILKNEKYAGIYTFNKAARKLKGKRNNRILKDDKEIIRTSGALPQIISEELFSEVQEMLNKKKRKKRNGNKASEPYILSGIIYCGKCGYKMHGETKTNRGKKYKYYSCSNRKNGCNQSSVSKSIVEEAIINKVTSCVFKPELAEIYTNKINKMIVNKAVTISDDLKIIEEQIKNSDAKIHNLLKAIEEGCVIPQIKDRIEEISGQKENLQLQYEKLQMQINRTKINVETVREFLQHNFKVLVNKQLGECQKLCGQYIEKVVVSDHVVEVHTILDENDINCVGFVGVGDGNRTHMVLTTRPSTVRVCLFRHPDT